MADQNTITINGKSYNVDELSGEAKAQLTNIRVVDQELARLQALVAIARTARSAYGQTLNAEIQKTHPN